MRGEIQKSLIKTEFYRPELIRVLKNFLEKEDLKENIPGFCRTPIFLEYLRKNDIEVDIKVEDEKEKEKEKDMKNKDDAGNEENNSSKIKKIIEEDNLELFQQETEKDKNIILEETFFEAKNMKIPIIHFCVMKKAMKCYKFLILNGADPSVKLCEQSGTSNGRTGRRFGRAQEPKHIYEWDCISVAIAFGEWEMMKILEERGIDKLNNPSVWEAAGLTHRNRLLKQFIEMKEEMDRTTFADCLKKGIEGSVKGNNLKGLKLLMKYYSQDMELEKQAKPQNSKPAQSSGRRRFVSRSEPELSLIENLLLIASEFDHYCIGKILISKGANINAKNKDGNTPLHYAAEKDSIKMGKLLISKGADINAKDNDN